MSSEFKKRCILKKFGNYLGAICFRWKFALILHELRTLLWIRLPVRSYSRSAEGLGDPSIVCSSLTMLCYQHQVYWHLLIAPAYLFSDLNVNQLECTIAKGVASRFM